MRAIPLILAAGLAAGAAFAQVPTTGAGAGSPVVAGGPPVINTPLFLLGSAVSVSLPSSGTSYNLMVGSAASTWVTTTNSRIFPLPVQGKFFGLEVASPTISITGGSETFSILGVTGSPSCIFQSGTPSACFDHATTSSSTAAGSSIAVQVAAVSPTGTLGPGTVEVSVGFIGDFSNESPIFGGNAGVASATAVNFMGVATSWSATENIVSFVMPTAGTLDSLYAQLGNTAGANSGYTYVVFKNGQATSIVAGDGSTTCWGAASLTCSDIAGCNHSTACTHSTHVVAGDTISVESCPSSVNNALLCPNQPVGAACSACVAPTARGISFGLRWMPDTPKEAVVFGTPCVFPVVNSGATRWTLASGCGIADGVSGAADANVIPYTLTSQTFKKWIVAYCTASGTASTSRNTSLETPLGTPLMTTGAVSTVATINCPAAGTNWLTASAATQDNSNTYTTSGPVTDGTLITARTVNVNAPPAYSAFKQAFVAVVN